MMARSYPAKAEAQRQRWADPSYRERWITGAKARWAATEHRTKMAAAGFRPVTAEDHRAEKLRAGDGPTKYSRLGVPTGYTRTSAAVAMAEAEQQADVAMRALEAQGFVVADVLPDSDEAMANAVLRELFAIAIGPGNSRTKVQALNTLLALTKAKPAERRAIKATFEDWLSNQL